jgi:crotonobetainyl-CoA:carnitine CoA-transferase CaiB-like acyl-CoA transferase
MADFGGGGLQAALGIMMALYCRDRTGKGQYVDISMMDGVAPWLGNIAARYFHTNESQKAGEAELAGGLVCYRTYETKDGRYLSVGALEPKFWANFCRLIEREDLVHQQLDIRADGKLEREMVSIFKSKTADEWLALLEGEDTCIERVNTIAEAMNDPQVLHRQMVVETDHPTEGRIKSMGISIKLSKTPGRVDRFHAPAYGEHTRAVLTQLGLSQPDIDSLARDTVI